MVIELERCRVRTYRLEDAPSLAKHANNRKVWLGLRDAFPHPYTVADGGIGFVLHADVERVSAEIGYWLSEAHWGKGIVTEALIAVRDYAIKTHGLTRVFAAPYSSNPASFRVLSSSGAASGGSSCRGRTWAAAG